jgi:hypothetical protein
MTIYTQWLLGNVYMIGPDDPLDALLIGDVIVILSTPVNSVGASVGVSVQLNIRTAADRTLSMINNFFMCIL